MGLAAMEHKIAKVLVDSYQDTLFVYCTYQDNLISCALCDLYYGDNIVT